MQSDSAWTARLDGLRAAIPGSPQMVRAEAESLLRQVVARGGDVSDRAYAVREIIVESLIAERHRPDPETCVLAERTLAHRVETATGDSAGVVRPLHLAARCAHRSGDLDRALGYHRRVVAILTRLRGAESYELSGQLNNLGATLSDAGLFRNMRDTLEQALAIRLRHRPPDDPAVLMIKNNLAVAHEAEGDEVGARPLYEEVVAGYEKSLGPRHPKMGYALHNLALTMVATGEPHRALALYERSLAVRESTANATRAWFEVGETLTSMSELLLDLDLFARAQPLLERALEIQTRELRADHPYRIRVLLGLATTHRAAGNHDAALRYARDALAALDSADATDHPDRAKTLVSLGEAELIAGRASAAVAHFESAVAIYQNALGVDHPRTATAKRRLSEALARTDAPRALTMALDAEQRQREHLRRSFRALSERQAFAVREAMSSGLDVALSCLAASREHADSLRASTWDALIRARGMLLDEVASRIQVASTDDSVLVRLARSFIENRQREVNLAVRGPRGEALDVYRRRLRQARQETDSAETALAKASVAFRSERTRRAHGWREATASLPPGGALVGYVRHADVLRAEAGARSLSSYGAFVVLHGERWPSFTSLGDAETIDSLVVAWRGAVSGQGVAEAGYRRAGAALRERIWDPIASRLEGARMLFMVPDGMLGLVNHATLPTGSSGYLLENEAPFHYLAGERGLMDERAPRGEPGELLAVGGVDYESLHGVPNEAASTRRVPKSRSNAATRRGATRGAAPGDCIDLPTLEFAPLPETRRELGDVCAIWEIGNRRGASRTLIGSSATEQSLRSMAPLARALHLATHGFFVDPACSKRSGVAAKPPLTDAYENPMVRTGLALAGANRKDRASAQGDDGIVTAAEFAAMDLRGLDWVVLSGCDTGAGTPASLEGLLGLRRAFEVSGAGTVIMSLWGIEDAPARRWTRTLYGARFQQGRSPAEAVREASLTLLRAQRKAGMGGHPGAWGSFVASGSWR